MVPILKSESNKKLILAEVLFSELQLEGDRENRERMIYFEEGLFWRPVNLEEIEEHLGKNDVELLISDGEGKIYRGKYSFVIEDGKKYRQIEVYSVHGVPEEQIRFYCVCPLGPIPLEEL